LQAAIREADALGHDVVGTEHLLIALAPESASSPAAADVTGTRLLSDLGVDADRLRETLSETRQRGRPSHEPPPPAQRVADKLARLSEARLDTAQLSETLAVTLDLAQEEAVYFGRPGADGGDLLIALAAGRDPVVDKALAELGLDADAVRAAVEHARGDDSPG
jgi:ATP-dependent Clp protease ATP-binding subunit ClpA